MVHVVSPVVRVCAARSVGNSRRHTEKSNFLVIDIVTLLRHDPSPTIRATRPRRVADMLQFLILEGSDIPKSPQVSSLYPIHDAAERCRSFFYSRVCR